MFFSVMQHSKTEVAGNRDSIVVVNSLNIPGKLCWVISSKRQHIVSLAVKDIEIVLQKSL